MMLKRLSGRAWIFVGVSLAVVWLALYLFWPFWREPGVFATSLFFDGQRLIVQELDTPFSANFPPRQGKTSVFVRDDKSWGLDEGHPSYGLVADLPKYGGNLKVVGLSGETAAVVESVGEIVGYRQAARAGDEDIPEIEYDTYLHIVVDRGGSWELEQTISESDVAGWLNLAAGHTFSFFRLDLAGRHIKIDGDALVLVGTVSDDSAEFGYRLAVFVFRRSGAKWSLDRQIDLADRRESWRFKANLWPLPGNLFDISGDTLVTLARTDDESANFAIRFFVYDGEAWRLEQEIAHTDLVVGVSDTRQAWWSFWAAELDGNTLAISAQELWLELEDEKIIGKYSKVYVLERGAGWSLQDEIIIATDHSGALPVLDLDADTLVVATVGSGDDGNPDSIMVFVRNGSSWQLQQTISANQPIAGVKPPAASFSFNMVSGFMVLDGDMLALVYRPEGGNSWNTIHIFERTSSVWRWQQTLRSD